jgi:hypothetical protein
MVGLESFGRIAPRLRLLAKGLVAAPSGASRGEHGPPARFGNLLPVAALKWIARTKRPRPSRTPSSRPPIAAFQDTYYGTASRLYPAEERLAGLRGQELAEVVSDGVRAGFLLAYRERCAALTQLGQLLDARLSVNARTRMHTVGALYRLSVAADCSLMKSHRVAAWSGVRAETSVSRGIPEEGSLPHPNRTVTATTNVSFVHCAFMDGHCLEEAPARSRCARTCVTRQRRKSGGRARPGCQTTTTPSLSGGVDTLAPRLSIPTNGGGRSLERI